MPVAPRGSVLAVALLLLTQAVQVPGLWYTRDLPSPRGPAIGSSVLERAAVEGCAILRNDPALHRGPPGLHVDPLELLDPLSEEHDPRDEHRDTPPPEARDAGRPGAVAGR